MEFLEFLVDLFDVSSLGVPLMRDFLRAEAYSVVVVRELGMSDSAVSFVILESRRNREVFGNHVALHGPDELGRADAAVGGMLRLDLNKVLKGGLDEFLVVFDCLGQFRHREGDRRLPLAASL